MARKVKKTDYTTKAQAIVEALGEGTKASYKYDNKARSHTVRVIVPATINKRVIKKAVRSQLPYRFTLDTSDKTTVEGTQVRRMTWVCELPEVPAKKEKVVHVAQVTAEQAAEQQTEG